MNSHSTMKELVARNKEARRYERLTGKSKYFQGGPCYIPLYITASGPTHEPHSCNNNMTEKEVEAREREREGGATAAAKEEGGKGGEQEQQNGKERKKEQY